MFLGDEQLEPLNKVSKLVDKSVISARNYAHLVSFLEYQGVSGCEMR